MAQLKYCDKHNQVGFLRKPDESAGFAEIVDFLRGSNLRYALTTNPTIYDSLIKQFWQTATANTNVDGTLEIKATIDTISSKSGGWDQFGSNIATALVGPIPLLISRIDSLEMDLKQTKLTMGNAIVKLVKKVKKLEGFLKRRNLVFVRLLKRIRTEGSQGEKSQDDPQDSFSQAWVTPSTTKGKKASGESRTMSIGEGDTREDIVAKDRMVVFKLDFQEMLMMVSETVNTASAELVVLLRKEIMRRENLPMINEEKLQRKVKGNKFYKREASMLKQFRLDISNEKTLAKQGKKYFAEERARAKRNKPMTQSQLKTYMMNYLKNQGTWKLS
ncbi:hypothetical protein Tco_1568763 [Tanacetum coccineum]